MITEKKRIEKRMLKIENNEKRKAMGLSKKEYIKKVKLKNYISFIDNVTKSFFKR